MYLLEIELLHQQSLKPDRSQDLTRSRGAYRADSDHQFALLHNLAKESWCYQQQCNESLARPMQVKQHDQLCAQQVTLAQQLVTDIMQPPLSIEKIIRQLEQEIPEVIALDKRCSGADILWVLDDETYDLDEWLLDTGRCEEG